MNTTSDGYAASAEDKRQLASRLFRNRTFVLLWSGRAVSAFGDAFFNIAVSWLVYTQSGSILQTAFIQVVWQLSDIIFSPIAGYLADRFNRKRIMVVTNLLAAIVVGLFALLTVVQIRLPISVVLLAIFLVNSLTTFLKPAQFSVMPAVVSKDLLASASGAISSSNSVAALIGSASAGIVIASLGLGWAIGVNAISFLFVAVCVIVAKIPMHKPSKLSTSKNSMIESIGEGWHIVMQQPVIKVLVWLSLLVNVASFLGPLYPALVESRLGSSARVYGILEMAAVIGGILGGISAGFLERRFGAGRVLILGWLLAGLCTLGVGLSQTVWITLTFQTFLTYGLVSGAVCLGVLIQALVSDEYLGRADGLITSLSVIAIPISALIGGWLADIFGVVPLFSFGGLWLIGIALLAWSNYSVREARL